MAAQLRLDHARVHGVRGDGGDVALLLGGAQPPRELGAEEHVGQLALLVRPPRVVRPLRVEVVEVDATGGVRQRREGDDAGGRGLDEPGQQQAGEEEVAEVVDAELQLEAVLGLHARAGHDAGVVDEQVDAGLRLEDLARALAHRLQVRQVEAPHHQLARARRVADARADLGRRLLGLLHVTARHHHPGPYPAQVQRRGLADARVAARDDDRLAVQAGHAAALAREQPHGGRAACLCVWWRLVVALLSVPRGVQSQ